VGCSYETRPQAKANYEKWVVVVGCALRSGGILQGGEQEKRKSETVTTAATVIANVHCPREQQHNPVDHLERVAFLLYLCSLW